MACVGQAMGHNLTHVCKYINPQQMCINAAFQLRCTWCRSPCLTTQPVYNIAMNYHRNIMADTSHRCHRTRVCEHHHFSYKQCGNAHPLICPTAHTSTRRTTHTILVSHIVLCKVSNIHLGSRGKWSTVYKTWSQHVNTDFIKMIICVFICSVCKIHWRKITNHMKSICVRQRHVIG